MIFDFCFHCCVFWTVSHLEPQIYQLCSASITISFPCGKKLQTQCWNFWKSPLMEIYVNNRLKIGIKWNVGSVLFKCKWDLGVTKILHLGSCSKTPNYFCKLLLTDWLTDWLAGWLAGWLTNLLRKWAENYADSTYVDMITRYVNGSHCS